VIESRAAKRVDWQYYRCDAIFDSLTAWLRQNGVKTQRPLHTLRKEFGSLVCQAHGIHATSKALLFCSEAKRFSFGRSAGKFRSSTGRKLRSRFEPCHTLAGSWQLHVRV
jgi:hypothetical protein